MSATVQTQSSPSLARRIPWRSLAIVVPFLAVFIALSIGSPAFLSFQNIGNVLDRQAGILIVAAASTLVIIAGGIDLSIGATYMFTAVICGTLIVKVGGVAGVAVGITVAVLAGLLVGIVNGVETEFEPGMSVLQVAERAGVTGVLAVELFETAEDLDRAHDQHDDEDDPDLEPEDDDGPDEVDLDTDSDGEQDDVPEAGTVTR